jgi:hypothetical protein
VRLTCSAPTRPHSSTHRPLSVSGRESLPGLRPSVIFLCHSHSIRTSHYLAFPTSCSGAVRASEHRYSVNRLEKISIKKSATCNKRAGIVGHQSASSSIVRHHPASPASSGIIQHHQRRPAHTPSLQDVGQVKPPRIHHLRVPKR